MKHFGNFHKNKSPNLLIIGIFCSTAHLAGAEVSCYSFEGVNFVVPQYFYAKCSII